MTTLIGRLIDLGIGKESTRGTPVAPTFWLPATEKGVEDAFELATDDASRGVIEAETDAKVSKRYSTGSVAGIIRDKSIGLLLLNLFGSVSTSTDTPEAGVNTHNFSVNQSIQHPSLTVALKHANENVHFALSMINSFELSIALGDYVRYTAEFIGKKGASASDTVSHTVENQFVAQHAIVKLASNLSGLDAASPIKLKSGTITFNKNVETDDIVGSVDPNDVLNKEFRIEGSIELLFTDTTLKALAIAGTEQAMRIELKNTDVIIGTTTNPMLQIDLAKVKFTEFARTSDNADLVRQTLDFVAYFSQSDSKMATAKLVNTQSSY